MSKTTVDVLGSIAPPQNRWADGAAESGSVLDELVHRSNLWVPTAHCQPGRRQHLREGDQHRPRRPRDADAVGQGLGSDLATISAGFAALRLDEVLPLRGGTRWTTRRWSPTCAVAPSHQTSRPSIETLSAFIPAAHVDHPSRCRHRADVVAKGRSLAKEAFGDEAVWLDYERPGFQMSKRIAELLRTASDARAVLLEHGLVTWGDTSRAAYDSTLEFVTRATRALEAAGAGRFGLGGRGSGTRGRRGRCPPVRLSAGVAWSAARRRRSRRAARRSQRRGDRLRLVSTRSRSQPDRCSVP